MYPTGVFVGVKHDEVVFMTNVVSVRIVYRLVVPDKVSDAPLDLFRRRVESVESPRTE
jgi:hypothetical protein